MWFWLASHLKMSLARVKRETSAREFERWRVYRIEERNHFHREDYYAAAIMAEVRRGNMRCKDPAKVKSDSFLIKFSSGAPLTQEERLKAIEASKFKWCIGVGADPKMLLAKPQTG